MYDTMCHHQYESDSTVFKGRLTHEIINGRDDSV